MQKLKEEEEEERNAGNRNPVWKEGEEYLKESWEYHPQYVSRPRCSAKLKLEQGRGLWKKCSRRGKGRYRDPSGRMKMALYPYGLSLQKIHPSLTMRISDNSQLRDILQNS